MSEYVSPSNVISRAGAGVVGGLAGGVVLGILLQVMGLMPAFAQLVGRYAALLDSNRPPLDAWREAIEAGGWEPAAE